MADWTWALEGYTCKYLHEPFRLESNRYLIVKGNCFSPQVSWSQGSQLLTAFGMDHSCKQVLQINSLDGVFIIPLSICFKHIAHCEDIDDCNLLALVAEESDNLTCIKAVPPWACKIDNITFWAGARLNPCVAAGAKVFKPVPNGSSQRKKLFPTGLGVRKGWMICKHIRALDPLQFQSDDFQVERLLKLPHVLNSSGNSARDFVLTLHAKTPRDDLVML